MFVFSRTRFYGALRCLALLRLNFLNAQLTREEESSHRGSQGKNSHGGGDPFEASELQTRPSKQDRGPQRQREHGRADPERGWRYYGQRGQVHAPDSQCIHEHFMTTLKSTLGLFICLFV